MATFVPALALAAPTEVIEWAACRMTGRGGNRERGNERVRSPGGWLEPAGSRASSSAEVKA
jgi:hypothetical protein